MSNSPAFRLGMAQILVEGGRPQANLDRAVGMIRRAAGEGCRLVVLPECLELDRPFGSRTRRAGLRPAL